MTNDEGYAYGRNPGGYRYGDYTYDVCRTYGNHCRYCKKDILRQERMLKRGPIVYHVYCYRLVFGSLPPGNVDE